MTVSYVITTYRRPDLLKNVLLNIKEIKDTDDELIVIDGGLDLETKTVVAGYNDLVDVYIRQKDRNEAHALNRGILVASCDLIKIFTDDDYLYRDGMVLVKEIFKNMPEVMVLQCGGIAVRKKYPDKPYSVQKLSADFSINNPDQTYRASCGLGLVFRREAVSILGLFDVSLLTIDNDFLARCIFLDVAIYYADIKLYKHITWEGSAQLNVEGCIKDNIRRFLRYGSFLSVFGESQEIALSCLYDYGKKNSKRKILYWSHWSLHNLYSHSYNAPLYSIFIVVSATGLILRKIWSFFEESMRRIKSSVLGARESRQSNETQLQVKTSEDLKWTGEVMRLGTINKSASNQE